MGKKRTTKGSLGNLVKRKDFFFLKKESKREGRKESERCFRLVICQGKEKVSRDLRVGFLSEKKRRKGEFVLL